MKKKVIVIVVIFIMIIVAIAIYRSNLFQKENQTLNDTRWKIKKVYQGSIEDAIESIAIVPRWEEMTITQKFNSVNFLENTYNTRSAKITSDLLGKKLGTSILSGYDAYTNTTYSINGEIYEINNFPEKCAIAVKLENDNEYYAYINTYYKPETLGEFIENLNLREIVDFGSVWYDDSYKDEQGNYHYEEIEFPYVTDDVIWKMLFSDESLPNIHSDNDWHNRLMSISVNIPLFGYENISVSVSEDGYLTTNIFETGKTFFIGKEKVQGFVDYVLENCDGYKTIYVDENGNEINDDMLEDEKDSETKNDTIMMYTNNLVEPPEANFIENQGKNFVEAYEENK